VSVLSFLSLWDNNFREYTFSKSDTTFVFKPPSANNFDLINLFLYLAFLRHFG